VDDFCAFVSVNTLASVLETEDRQHKWLTVMDWEL